MNPPLTTNPPTDNKPTDNPHYVSSGMVNTEGGGQLQLTGRDAKDGNNSDIDNQAEGKQSGNESKEDHHHHHNSNNSNNNNNNIENEFLESGDEGLAGGITHITSYHAMSCHVMSCHVILHCIISYHIISTHHYYIVSYLDTLTNHLNPSYLI